MRRAAKTDSSQQEIVDSLRKAGYRVEIIKWPVDLLVGKTRVYRDITHDEVLTDWKILELKTPTKTGKLPKRKDQEKQDEFCKSTGTPRVTNLEQALEALKGL